MKYGMYSAAGNSRVHHLLMTARREGWDWPKMDRHLTLLARSNPALLGECTDTVVREAVHAALLEAAE
jgi:hypothetical protein